LAAVKEGAFLYHLLKQLNMVKTIIYLLSALAGTAFLAGILYAGYYTLWVEQAPKPDNMPDFLLWSVTVIGGVLATNFGAVLGISLTPETLRFNDVKVFQALKRNANTSVSSSSSSIDRIQKIAVYVYLLGLLLALLFFVLNGFQEDAEKSVLLLPELSKTLIGAAVGALAVALGSADN